MSIVSDLLSKRNGNYCHCVEFEQAYELECFIEQCVENFARDCYTADEIREFINSLTIYALNDDYEQEVYDFDVQECLESCLDDVDYLLEDMS